LPAGSVPLHLWPAGQNSENPLFCLAGRRMAIPKSLFLYPSDKAAQFILCVLKQDPTEKSGAKRPTTGCFAPCFAGRILTAPGMVGPVLLLPQFSSQLFIPPAGGASPHPSAWTQSAFSAYGNHNLKRI